MQFRRLYSVSLRKRDVANAGRQGERSEVQGLTHNAGAVGSSVGGGAGENASLFAEGIALHISDTGSRAAERDCRRRKKQAMPRGKRRLFERGFAHAWALTCLGIRFCVCRTWSLRNVFRVLKKAPTVGKSVVGIGWDACLWADAPRCSQSSFGCLEQNENPGKRLPVILIASRSFPSFSLAFSPILFPLRRPVFLPLRTACPCLAPACAFNMPPSSTPTPQKVKKF